MVFSLAVTIFFLVACRYLAQSTRSPAFFNTGSAETKKNQPMILANALP